jgi:hypothetical protein
MKMTEPADTDPLEWWEEKQLQILERLGEDVSGFRADPSKWRETRRQLSALKKGRMP